MLLSPQLKEHQKLLERKVENLQSRGRHQQLQDIRQLNSNCSSAR
jgi:hypothetical protein